MEIPRIVEQRQIAGAEKTVCGEGSGVVFGAGPALAGGDVSGNFDRARLTRRQDAAGIGVDNADSHAQQRRALARHTPVERPG